MTPAQTQEGGAMAMQETLVGAALAFVGTVVMAVSGAVIHLFFRVVRLETYREVDAKVLNEIRGDVKKLMVANGVADSPD